MKIQDLSGGLANQIRHYIFVRFAERYRPEDNWYFDNTSFFVTKQHNGYELERVFGLKLKLLSDFFCADMWQQIIEKRRRGSSMAQILLDLYTARGESLVVVDGRHGLVPMKFTGEIIVPDGPHLGFRPELITLPYQNVYYHADWAKKEWFTSYEKENLAELHFPPITDAKNQEYADLICSSFSIGIHIRRGDFVDTWMDCPIGKYQEGCKTALNLYPDAHFFVFSDELEWCRAHAKDLGLDLPAHITYVSGNIKGKNYIDMQLLSMCRGIIRNAESSFSQVAGWLNRNLAFELKVK